MEQNPRLFIVCGGRRTGTTLLAAILSSDERANPLGQESQILTRFVEAYRWGRVNFERFGLSFFRDEQSYRAFFKETFARFTREVAAEISPGGVLVLKNPELSLSLQDIDTLFPDAKILATVRDPRDQIASELEVGARQITAGMQNPDFETRNIAGLAQQYLAYYSEIITLYNQQPDRILIVRYEDLVFHPEETIANLGAHLHLNFDPKKPWQRVSPLAGLQSGPSKSDLYGAPISSRSVGRHERDLKLAEIAAIEEICAAFMALFGYERNYYLNRPRRFLLDSALFARRMKRLARLAIKVLKGVR